LGQISLKNFYWLPQIIPVTLRQGNWAFLSSHFFHLFDYLNRAMWDGRVDFPHIKNFKKDSMQQANSGDTVKVHYHGRLTDGTTFDSSAGREPLEFQVGSGMVIPGFDNGIVGMQVGEKKTIQIPVAEAYGPKNPDMIVAFPVTEFPEDMELEVGMRLNMTNSEGHVIPVVVTEIGEENIMLDANHPLAGEDLVFDIELVEIGAPPSRIIMP
jgi:FKBP-type peptidyl-prolyl cis-trans isomerase 2